ncbi:MAG: hypothetical protein ACKVW3_02215 [Phycisphaerales bacterium]
MATATDGTRQGGWVNVPFPGGGTASHAALWDGSSSWLDLNPGPTYYSLIAGMAPGIQVGFAKATTSLEHAAVWRGSAGTFEDWHPPNAGYSRLTATTGEFHAGWGSVSGSAGQVALVWLGSPNNVINLQSFLPSNYFLSEATSIWAGDGRIVVGGWAQDINTAQKHAFMWVGVPTPGTAAALVLGGVIFAMRRRR